MNVRNWPEMNTKPMIIGKRFGFGQRHRKYHQKLSHEILRHVKQSCHLSKKEDLPNQRCRYASGPHFDDKRKQKFGKNYEIGRVMRKLLNIIIRIVPIIRCTLETWGQTTKSEIKLIKILKENWDWWKFDGDL